MMNQRGSRSPCPGCDNHQPFLKLSRWLQPLSKKGLGEESHSAGGAARREEEGKKTKGGGRPSRS
jgi:hypothetical protein